MSFLESNYLIIILNYPNNQLLLFTYLYHFSLLINVCDINY